MVDMSRMPESAMLSVLGDGRCRERQRVDLTRELLELFLVRYAEALLLVDDEKAKVLEVQTLLQQRVCANE